MAPRSRGNNRAGRAQGLGSQQLGPSQGGTPLALHGANFTSAQAGANAVSIGGVPATAVVTVHDGLITCLAPAGAPGSRADVRVWNQGGSATLAAAYRYHLQPVLSGVSPSEGSAFGGELLTLRGSGFASDQAQGHEVRLGAASASELSVVDDTTLTCRVPPGSAGATVDIELSLSNGAARLPAAFRYRPAPTLQSLSPSGGSPLGGTLVTLSGAGFAQAGAGTTRVSFGAGTASQVSVSDDTTLTCRAPPGLPLAQVDVRLQNDNGEGLLTAAYRYHAAPLIAGLAPGNGPASGGTTVLLTGSGFRTSVVGANAVTFGGRPARSVTTVDDARVRAVAPSGPAGESVAVVLTNSNGSAIAPQGFRYNAAPSISEVMPSAASPLGGALVTLRGSGFQRDGAGPNAVLLGSGPASEVTVLDDQRLLCRAPPGPPGPVSVRVDNANGSAVLANGFTYDWAPTVTGIEPALGSSLGGLDVTLSGGGFDVAAAGPLSVLFGSTPATDVRIQGGSSLVCRVPPGPPATRVPVTVANARGSSTLDGFVYHPQPTLVGVEPSTGPPEGGTSVTLRGSGFAANDAGAAVVRFGASSASGVSVVDDATVRCTAPPGPSRTFATVSLDNANGSSMPRNGRARPGAGPAARSGVDAARAGTPSSTPVGSSARGSSAGRPRLPGPRAPPARERRSRPRAGSRSRAGRRA
jgi:hypothetical protein